MITFPVRKVTKLKGYPLSKTFSTFAGVRGSCDRGGEGGGGKRDQNCGAISLYFSLARERMRHRGLSHLTCILDHLIRIFHVIVPIF